MEANPCSQVSKSCLKPWKMSVMSAMCVHILLALAKLDWDVVLALHNFIKFRLQGEVRDKPLRSIQTWYFNLYKLFSTAPECHSFRLGYRNPCSVWTWSSFHHRLLVISHGYPLGSLTSLSSLLDLMRVALNCRYVSNTNPGLQHHLVMGLWKANKVASHFAFLTVSETSGEN